MHPYFSFDLPCLLYFCQTPLPLIKYNILDHYYHFVLGLKQWYNFKILSYIVHMHLIYLSSSFVLLFILFLNIVLQEEVFQQVNVKFWQVILGNDGLNQTLLATRKWFEHNMNNHTFLNNLSDHNQLVHEFPNSFDKIN